LFHGDTAVNGTNQKTEILVTCSPWLMLYTATDLFYKLYLIK